ncbi:hypothetical protein D3C80_2143680 [compost metagenome]
MSGLDSSDWENILLKKPIASVTDPDLKNTLASVKTIKVDPMAHTSFSHEVLALFLGKHFL